ncbi:hypothetical protein GCM10023195_78740 [Actinoallomurus liliacearum]|uniref:Transcription factor zinc-finger domain-containing protein n=3 Tax=Actinoallomurus TaxID=667113 RepID=A0ABP8TW59_9ACTN
MIEECVGCHGVFLDRGELDRLIDAESDYLANLDADTDAAGSYHGRHRRGIMHQIFTPVE